MPIYEYQCPKCGVVEVTQRITEAPLKKCPNCKSKVERIISRSSFVLKGSGWYATDYANKGKKDTSDSSEKASNGTSTETKSESKTESKPSTDSKSSISDKASTTKSEKPSTTKSAD